VVQQRTDGDLSFHRSNTFIRLSLANLARESCPQNEKPDLLSGKVNFWFDASALNVGKRPVFHAQTVYKPWNHYQPSC
jgi:hypothetical protein